MGLGTQRADHIAAPTDMGRTADDFGVRKIAVTTTHGVNPLPAEWAEKWIEMVFIGAATVVHVAFSTSATAEVDTSTAAAAAGATTQGASDEVGMPYTVNTYHHVKLPFVRRGETLYFVREGDDTATAYLRLA